MSGQISYLTKKSKGIMFAFFLGICVFNVSASEVETIWKESNPYGNIN